VSAQILDRTLTCYRIGDPDGAYPIFDATGSRLAPGRWNSPASPMIYAALHYSTVMLEKLVHGSGRMPPNQHYITITVPRGLSYEVFHPAALPGWDGPDESVPQRFGEEWYTARRSVILLVPSVIARVDQNVLINPDHPEFRLLDSSLHRPVVWDRRLFATADNP
jgi:RES domain-containing protein